MFRRNEQVGRRVSAFSNFSPKQVGGGSLKLWARADLGITLNGGNVSAWADQSGNGNHILQATASKQPAYSSSSGPASLAALTFDGVDDTMSASFVLAQPEHVFVVSKVLTSSGSDLTWMDGPAAGNQMRAFRQGASGFTGAFAGSAIVAGSGTPLAWHYHAFQFNGASSSTKQDGTVIASGNAGTNSGNGVVLGTFGDGAFQPTNVAFAELIIYNQILSAADEARVNAYLKARYLL